MAERNAARNERGTRARRSKAPSAAPDRGRARRDSDVQPVSGATRRKGRERSEIQALVAKGKGKGYLTYDEVNAALPPDMVSSEQIDDVMVHFGEQGIDVIDAAHEAKATARLQREQAARRAMRKDDSDDEEEDDAPPQRMTSSMPPPADDGLYSKSNDPVRLYLRKMGAVSLLTREGRGRDCPPHRTGREQGF